MSEPPPKAESRVSLTVREAIRGSGESIRVLAARHCLNPKTVAKWRGREVPTDHKRGPAVAGPRTLDAQDERSILAFRRYLPLSLDDSMATLGARLPALSRSVLHRLLRRHDLSRPPRRASFGLPEGAARPGCFHIDIVPVATGGAQHYLFFAVEQSSALIFGLLRPDATQATARDFLGLLADGSPAPVRLILTSDRFQFTMPGNAISGAGDVREALEKGLLIHAHPFEYACAIRGIEHHIVPDHYPWDAERADRIASAAAGIATMAAPDADTARNSLYAELARHNDCPLPSLGGLSPGGWLAAAAVDARSMKIWDDEAGGNQLEPLRSGRESTRESILKAAQSRLAKDGPEGLSLSEVARIAGVNRGTAYQHFKTRDLLIAATGAWMSEKLHHAVFAGRTPSAAALGEKGMASVAGRLARFAMDNPELCRAWLLQLLSSLDPVQDLFWRDYRTAMTALVGKPVDGEKGMDVEVASVAMLAGALLWPTWARGGLARDGRGAPPDAPAVATRFALEWLRIAGPVRQGAG